VQPKVAWGVEQFGGIFEDAPETFILEREGLVWAWGREFAQGLGEGIVG